MRETTPLLVAALLVAVVVTLPARIEGEPPDIARGAKLYSDNCGRCHNARGPGEFSDAKWPLIITHMRVIAGLPGEQARTIEAFLLASNNPPPRRLPSAEAVSPLSGDELIQRSGCRGCHTIGGKGGTIGPNLAGVVDRRGEEWVRSQIQKPRQHNPKTIMPELGLTDAEVTRIIEALERMDGS